MLDFTGGSLSVIQLVMDCGINNDWSGAVGDPVKFGLGFTSMVFDVVFMVQHYCLYATPSAEGAAAVVISSKKATTTPFGTVADAGGGLYDSLVGSTLVSLGTNNNIQSAGSDKLKLVPKSNSRR